MSNSSLEQIDLDRLLPRNNTVPRTIGQVSPQGPVRSPGARPFPASPNRSRSVMSPPPNRGKSQQRANNEELYNFPPNYQPYIRGKSNSSNSTDSSVGESTRLQNARVVAPAVPILQSKTDIRRLSSPATVGLSNSLAIEQSSNARSVSVDELEPVVLDANFVG